MGDIISYPGRGISADGYLAEPGTGTAPAVLVLHEWWGLVPHVREICDRFADAGFRALAPDLYHGVQAGGPDEAATLAGDLDLDRVADDLAGAVRHLGGSAAVVGFGLGAGLALWAPGRVTGITAAVGFYPMFPWAALGPQWTATPTLIHHADTAAKPGLPAPATLAEQACTGVRAAGGSVAVHHYAGTRHAFVDDDRPEVYDRDAARVSWARTLAFLRSTVD